MTGQRMLSEAQWALAFGAAKSRGAKWKDLSDVQDYKAELLGAIFQKPDRPEEPEHRCISQKGIDLIHGFETLQLKAYKDPGSKNGLPITCGWGTTVGEDGKPIKLGEVWTKEKADRLFRRDITIFSAGVDKLLSGAPTTQDQFDAMVSLAYNIGLDDDKDTIAEGFGDSSLLRKHKAGDYAGAAKAFGSWIYNDGKKMNGLIRRRASEALLYQGRA